MEVNSLVIDGSGVGYGYLIMVDGEPYEIQGNPFRYLVRLAVDRKRRRNGGTPIDDFQDGPVRPAQIIYILRRQVPFKVVRSAVGYYEIDVPANVIRFNYKNLSGFWDSRVSELFSPFGKGVIPMD